MITPIYFILFYFIFIRVCIWVAYFYKLDDLAALIGWVCSQMTAKLLCSWLSMHDAIVESRVMNVQVINDFLIGKWKWIL